MQKIIATTIIFVAVILNSIFTTIYTSCKFTGFSTNLIEIEETINLNKWQLAEHQINNLISEFKHQEKKLQLFLNRNNLEKIQQNLNKLKISIEFKNKMQSKTQIIKIKKKMTKIIEDEKPLIQNIL